MPTASHLFTTTCNVMLLPYYKMNKPVLISLQISKSHRFLADADDMVQQKRWEIAANRYYYACYHMVQAAFIMRDITTKTHDGCLTELGKNFIMTGDLDKKFGRFFARMIQLRIKADYNSIAEVTEPEVLEMAPLSREFVAQIEILIKNNINLE